MNNGITQLYNTDGSVIYPYTFPEAILFDENTTLKDINNSEVFINLDKYNITNLNIDHKAPYNNLEYQMAYNNLNGIQQALNDLSEAGYKNINLPKGTYCVCYQNPSGNAFYGNYGWEIKLPSNINFNLNGSTIRVIFDSDNRNPYDNSTSQQPYQLNGCVFSFNKTERSTLENGIILGDRYERSFNNASEKNQDQTYGIKVTNGSLFNNVINMEISGFMGDSITGDGNHNPDKGSAATGSNIFTNIALDDKGVEITNNVKPYVFTSDYQDLTNIVSKNNYQMVLRTNIGYSYEFASDYNFDIYFYDKDKNFLSKNTYEQLDNIKIPYNSLYCRISIINVANSGNSTLDMTYQLTPITSQFFNVRNCKIYNNNRGGLSNLPHDILIENCEIFDNGTAGTQNFPVFGDSTRYAINCEDTVCRKIIIRNNYIHDGFNGILLSAKYSLFEGNVMKNFISSVSVYYGKDNIVTNNKFENCASPNFSKSTNRRTLIVTNNIFKNCSITTNNSIIFNNNHITTKHMTFTSTNDLPLNIGIVEEELDTKDVYRFFNIEGKYENSIFNFNQPQFSTCRTALNIKENSKNVIINFNNDAKLRRITPYNINNCIVNGGFINIDTTSITPNINNSVLNTSRSFCNYMYGNDKIICYNINNTTINAKSDFDDSANSIFYITKNVSYTEQSFEFILKLNNCIINIEKESIKSFIHMSGFNIPPKKIILQITNCTFNNTSDTTVSIFNLNYKEQNTNSSIYELIWENNTLNGNFIEPPQPIVTEVTETL